MAATENTEPPTPVAAAPAAALRPARTTRPSTSRRPGVKKAAPAGTPAGGTDLRFENGPLAVVDVKDGQVLAYCTGGLVLNVPAKSIPALVDWTLRDVLTQSALERYGLPTALTEEERLAGSLPEGHKVIKQLVRAEWKLTKRGFGPWARNRLWIYFGGVEGRIAAMAHVKSSPRPALAGSQKPYEVDATLDQKATTALCKSPVRLKERE